MKSYKIPYSNFEELANKLEENWNKPEKLFSLINNEFIYKYKVDDYIEDELMDKANIIASEIKIIF